MSRGNSFRRSGFTLVEMLVIAPIALLVITGFIALMVTMVGDVIASRSRNVMTYDIQSAINTIEQDVRLSTEFLASSGNLPSPQGKNDTTPFTSTGNDLILGSIATNKNPIDPTRNFIYYSNSPFACNSNTAYQNRIFFVTVIYTVRDGSLWRRTYVPTASGLCENAWQVNSCAPGYTIAQTQCQATDTEILKNVKNFNVDYFINSSDLSAIDDSSAPSASSIKVTMGAERSAAGRPITALSTGQSTKLSSKEINLAPPASPVVTGTASEKTATFTWAGVPTATSYIVKYNINGGAWVTASENSTETIFSVPSNHGDTVSLQVMARNTTGASSVASASTTIPRWLDCALGNGWTNYDEYHEKCSFTITSHGVVMIQGEIRAGTIANGTLLFTLPAGYRPSHRLIFQGLISEQPTRIDIDTNGTVAIVEVPSVGAGAYLSISGISFIPSQSGYSKTLISPSNGWSNYGDPYPPLQSVVDASGRIHVQGMLNTGTITSGTPFGTLASGTAPTQSQLYSTRGDWTNPYNEVAVMASGSNAYVSARGRSTSWLSVQLAYYPSSIPGWQNLVPIVGDPTDGRLGNGWVHYDAGGGYWANPQYIKASDGIVKLKGLIRSGSTTPGVRVARLPVGYRPRNRLVFNTASENGFTRIDMHADGYITMVSGGSAGWTSLESVQFIAEQ